MRYGEDDRESTNVEDRRGEGGGMFRGGGGGIPIPLGGGGLSITSLLVIGAICLMLGINPLELLSGSEGMPRMPDGHPDLQGTYDLSTMTPLVRQAGDPPFLTKDQADALQKAELARRAVKSLPSAPDRSALRCGPAPSPPPRGRAARSPARTGGSCPGRRRTG